MPRPPRATRATLRNLDRDARRCGRGRFRLLRSEGEPAVGYAVGKSIGNAVVRNKVRRRLREAVGMIAQGDAIDATYLVIALAGADRVGYDEMVSDLRFCFEEVND